jgi:hypothetical protein
MSRRAVAHSRVRFGLGVKLKKCGVQWSLRGVISALKSGPVPVFLPFLEGLRLGLVLESFRTQEPRTGTEKNCKKLQKTGRN